MHLPTNRLVKFLQQNRLSIALAESVTCGLISHQLGTVRGVSDVFRGSIVCYDPAVKISLMKIRPSLIERCTAESQEVTDALARQLTGLIDADVCCAVTGLACEDGSETKTKPVGTVFMSMYFRRRIYRQRLLFRGTPTQIREKISKALCTFVWQELSQQRKT